MSQSTPEAGGSSFDYAGFVELVESQDLRTVRRYLDYDKRIKSGGLEELAQWIGKILLDDGQIYALDDMALAFEIAACEQLAEGWQRLEASPADATVIAGTVDKTFLLRQICSPFHSDGQKAAFLQHFRGRYKKQATWIRDRSRSLQRTGEGEAPTPFSTDASGMQLFREFLDRLEESMPLPGSGIGAGAPVLEELSQLRSKVEDREARLAEITSDLEFAEDRDRRAHQRLHEVEESEKRLAKQLREARVEADNIREERSRRIKLERELAEISREAERLREEYVKQESRLHQMARRLAAAEKQRSLPMIDVSAMRELDASQILGVEGRLSDAEASQVRRLFAAVFHSDRVKRLPVWVGRMCDDVLAVVNEACDRIKG